MVNPPISTVEADTFRTIRPAAVLPQVTIGETLTCKDFEAKSHTTQPPNRYSEASLTRALEEMGIGRPSTYASIIDTILAREYVFKIKRGNVLVPTWTAFAVSQLLELHLPDLVDYKFTAEMEDELDAISRGEMNPTDYLTNFYFGNEHPGLKKLLANKIDEIDAREVCRIPLGTPEGGEEIFIRISENFGGGRHSKEWLPAAAIRDTMSKSMQRGEPFKSTAMTAAFKGKSQNNSGFLVAALRAEGLFAEDETHKGMSRLAGDFDSWEKAMREAAPILKEDGQPETAKLHPEPKETRFKPKQVDASNDAPQDDEKPKPRPVRVSKKVMAQLAAARAAESEAVSTDDNDAAEPIGGTEAAVG